MVEWWRSGGLQGKGYVEYCKNKDYSEMYKSHVDCHKNVGEMLHSD